MTTAYDLLAAHPFLAGIEEQDLLRLSYWSRRSVFHCGTRIFSAGSKADRFWLVRDGTVRLDAHLPDRGDVEVETVGSGGVLGWSWLFPPYKWHFSATALDASLAVEFNAAGVRRLCESDAALGYELMRRFMAVVIERLQATQVRLLNAHWSPA